jgi:hypothetical protein
MMRRTILLVATMALSLFAANCVLLLAQDLTQLDLHPKDREQGGRLRPLEHCENIGALAESGQSREEIAMRKIGRRDLLLKRRDA